jgi:hypothetical protein
MTPSAARAAEQEGEPMTSPMRAARTDRPMRFLVLALVAALVAACTSGPQSQATTASEAPATAATSTAPASEAPTTPEPASATPSDAATPPPSSAPTPLVIPPKPAKVTWKQLGIDQLGGGQSRERYRVAWTSPEGAATQFTVYGVTSCLRESKKNDGKACVVKGMKIPKGALKLIAQVPGSARSVDIAWKVGEIGPGPYSAVLVRASNDAGDSIFTIAWSADVCWRCTY